MSNFKKEMQEYLQHGTMAFSFGDLVLPVVYREGLNVLTVQMDSCRISKYKLDDPSERTLSLSVTDSFLPFDSVVFAIIGKFETFYFCHLSDQIRSLVVPRVTTE